MNPLIKHIYENVTSNAQRYWARTSLLRKLYHDAELCKMANATPNHIAMAYSNIRESLIDSAIISLTRGFLDKGQDSFSLTRLLPSSCKHLLTRKDADARLNEEDSFFQDLYENWHKGHPSNGAFVNIWYELSTLMTAFRGSGNIHKINIFRDNMVAHKLVIELDEPPEFTTLYDVRNDIVPIMNKLSALVECKATAWDFMLADYDQSANGFTKVLLAGFKG